MEHLYEKALESAEYIKTHTKKRPKIAVVLGSGLGKLTADFTDTEELSYKDIPNFPVSTVAGHKGALLAGKLGDTEVYAMEGRFHFYEGYSMKEVCYPFYVFKLLDVEKVGQYLHAHVVADHGFRHGAHAHGIGSHPRKGANFSRRFIARAHKAHVNALLVGNAQFIGGLLGKVPQFQTVRFGHVREAGAEALIVGANEGVRAHHVDEVGNEHQAPCRKPWSATTWA